MQSVQSPPPPALPLRPAEAPASLTGQEAVVVGVNSPSAGEVLRAFEAQRDELRGQLNTLTGERYAIARRLREGEVSGVDKSGLEARIQQLDTRMLEVNKAIGVADLRVATQKGVPGAYVEPFTERGGPPREVLQMGFALALVILLPASLAIARRIWRRGTPAVATAAVSREMDERLSRLEQAMDAVAVEVERVGEGQRYVTRMLGAGAAEPIAARVRESVEVKQ